MTDNSIRDLREFVRGDALQRFSLPLELEQQVLASYTFLSHVRTGIAAALTTPFSFDAAARGVVNVTVPVIADIGPVVAGPVQVTVRGPGDVVSIDAAQVIRSYPLDGHSNAETEDLVHVEFDRPDFPWMFTPTAPDAKGHLVPWVTLIVAERGAFTIDHPPGRLPRIRVRRDQLQSLDDAWAWAHAQVMGPTNTAAGDQARASIKQRLSDANPTMNLSRVMCPRHLDIHTEYIACLVPTFQAGVEAALGADVATATLAPAWTQGGDLNTSVVLPVYFSFQFATGDAGNFESLAHALQSMPAPPNIGRRRMDTSSPGNGIDPIPEGESGREQVVEGPVVSLADPVGQAGWPSLAAQEWPSSTTATLREQLNAADANLLAPEAQAPAQPTVTPPVYAGTSTARTRVESSSPAWFQGLNLEAKHRVIAGLGTRVVQMDQEALMASAWNQIAGVEAANLALRLAQYARYVGASLHRRHLAGLEPSAQLSVTERVHARVLAGVATTIFARVAQSSLPLAATSGAFRRATRARGPIARFAARTAVERAAIVSSLVAERTGVTRDWVRTYVNPDGVAAISPASRAMVSHAMARQVFGPGVSASDALMQRHTALSLRPALPEAFHREAIEHRYLQGHGSLGQTFGTDTLARLLASMPTSEQMARDRKLAVRGAGHALLLRQFVDATAGKTWQVDRAQAHRLGLRSIHPTTPPDPAAPARFGKDAAVVDVASDALLELASTPAGAARQFAIQPAELTLERDLAAQLVARLRAAPGVTGAMMQSALLAISSRLVRAEGPRDIARDRISIPVMNLAAKLHPAVTVTARLKGRLGVLPEWLRPDWFDDLRVQPVMAGPSFAIPMWPALYRYDKEWMIPGVGQIDLPDIVTLLKTNNQFIEPFLIGLNHEMGRELLWRGYPTDARGTYFKSFWTGSDELREPLHAFTDVALGKHMKDGLDNRIVMLVRGELVRRYPGVIGHAVQQAGTADNGLPLFEAGDGAPVLFRVHLAPNILLVAFDLLPETVKRVDQVWWFLLSENPTEPRFGLDDGPAVANADRDHLTWSQFLAGLPQGRQRFLSPATPSLTVAPATWGRDSAAVAHLLFQLPARAAFRGTRMLAKVGV